MEVIHGNIGSGAERGRRGLQGGFPFLGGIARSPTRHTSSASPSPSSIDVVNRPRGSSVTNDASSTRSVSSTSVTLHNPAKKAQMRGVRPYGVVRRQQNHPDSSSSCGEDHELVQAVRSPEIHRVQLQAEFMHYYFPWTAQEPHFIPTRNIIMHQTKTLTLQTALDALYLIQIGSAMHDERFIMHGKLSYQAALQRVRRDLSRPNSCYDDSLLAAVHMLATCEGYESLNQGENTPAQEQHMYGAAHLLQLRGPLSIKTEMQQYQLQQHLLHALFLGCFTRKASIFGREDWAAVTADGGPIAQLINSCLRAPTLLEQVDLFREASKDGVSDSVDALVLLMDLQKLETELQTWLTVWNDEIHHPSSYTEVDSLSFPFVDNLPAELAKVWPTAYEFKSFTCASVHSVCWFTTMLLREAMKDVQELRPWSAFGRRDQSELINGLVDEAAEKMCKCVLYLAQREHGTHGFASACAPLRFAAQWYGRSGDEQKLAWCNECLVQVNEVNGVRARFLVWRQPPSLAKPAD
nr:hypothetical protein CFP56_57599 [Quercus suber]